MNGLIPALLCVLLAEIGAPLGTVAIRRANMVAFGVALLVFAGAGIGWQFSGMMADNARTLMLGVLLVFAASGQLWITKPPRETTLEAALAISRSPAPGLAFGLAAFFADPVTPALGTLFAVALASAAGMLGLRVPPLARRIAGGVLLIAGFLLALRAFALF